MKKEYIKPQMKAIETSENEQLMAGSPVNNTSGNTDLHGAGDGGAITGGSGIGRSREASLWGEE